MNNVFVKNQFEIYYYIYFFSFLPFIFSLKKYENILLNIWKHKCYNQFKKIPYTAEQI